MPKPYSYDLRQKVIQAIQFDGLKKSEASQLFNISRNTIDLWLKRLCETGDYQAKPNQPPGNGHKITKKYSVLRSQEPEWRVYEWRMSRGLKPLLSSMEE